MGSWLFLDVTLGRLLVSCWRFGTIFRSHIQGLTLGYCSGRSSRCAVFSLEPLTQDPVYPSSSILSCPTRGLKLVLVEDILLWSSEQFTWSILLLGLVAKFCFGEFSGAVKGFCAGSVCCTCVAGSPFTYCLGTEIYIFCTTKPARSIGTYFVSKVFHDCIIFNILV